MVTFDTPEEFENAWKGGNGINGRNRTGKGVSSRSCLRHRESAVPFPMY